MQTKTTNPPELSTVLDEAERGTKSTLNCVQIGIINSFNSEKQTATVQIAIKQIVEIKPDGSRTIKEYPLILECPVMTLFGGESFINLPIQAGDNCIVLFNDREIDNWLYNGGVQVPTTRRVHDLSDAIAIVGIRSYQNSIASFLANGIRISFSANSQIDLTEDEITAICDLFTLNGDMLVNGIITADELHAGNGANGNFSSVEVVDGIVVNGS